MNDRAKVKVFDGHNDVLFNLFLPERGGGRSFFERSDIGHIDLPRALEGGFAGGFFAMMTPSVPPKPVIDDAGGYAVPMAPQVDHDHAQKMIIAVTASLFRIERESEGRLKIVTSVQDIETCIERGAIAAIMHFEGAEPIDPELTNLEVFYRAGLRSMGLVWSRPNLFAEGVPFRFPHSPDTGPGLTEAGRRLVAECNRLGILIDLSHLNMKGFFDVAELSDAPLVATHSNAHAICPITRNLTDDQLAAVAASDGMVGVNFAVSQMRPDGKNEADTPLSVLLQHVDYLVERLGIDRVGFGSDYDGARMPNDVGNVSKLQNLIEALRTAGYDEESINKLAHRNWLRVLAKTWKPA